ncbi:MAG: DUF3368 domain-containing protein [Promethearchaeota archaeon]|nr:MAG: DUF3368 domain-containing protein [Candidatus Lokiarchaeota archaeon]
MDVKKIRNVYRVLGGKVTGTLGILINSLKEKSISKKEALELLRKLNNFGSRMSLELYETGHQTKNRRILNSSIIHRS